MKRPSAQTGLSLVGLLVGIALGLLVVAAATTLLLAHLREARRLVLETRLAQDLSHATELIGNELRRTGHWSEASNGVRRAGAGPVPGNPLAAQASEFDSQIVYRYDSVGRSANGPSGFRLRDAAVEMQIDAGPWQALTDNAVLAVTDFRVTPSWRDASLAAFCLAPCPIEGGDCPPRSRQLTYEIAVRGHLVADPGTQRASHARVRVRNDAVIGRCPE